MFIPWWGIGILAAVLVYLIFMVMHLHNRVQRLERVLRRLEGISEEDLKKQIRDKMLQNDESGRA
ncbi:MAG: hypothetical protein P4L67_01115 [Candidatus Pacebacteria bacterium]|nr:hypothetical protein [Candidatus Paceibacterota bacterium]